MGQEAIPWYLLHSLDAEQPGFSPGKFAGRLAFFLAAGAITFNKYLLISVLLSFLLYYGKALFVPMMYGLFSAIVLYPICCWLQQHHCSKTFAITLSLLLVAILFVAWYGWWLCN
ncbi:MAG: hypothetical protein ABI760_23000 [Ferruginibacter sp.]